MLDRMPHARSLCLTFALLLLGCYADAVTGTTTVPPSTTTISTITAPATTTAAVPQAPTQVTCFNQTSSTLTINITSTDGANIDQYNISIVSSLTNWSSPVRSFAVVNRSSDAAIHTISNLIAGVLYNISVRSLNGNTPSATTTDASCRTALNPPPSVDVFGINTNTINVNWTSPSGYYEGFQVNCTGKNGSTNSSANVYAVGRPDANGQQQSANCTGVTSGAIYDVTVATFLNSSTSQATTSRTVVTIPQSSYNLTPHPVSSSSIELSWSYYKSDVSQCTEFYIRDNSSSSTVHTSQCNIGQLQYQYTLNNLKSDTLYAISVIAASTISGVYKESSSTSATSWTLPDKVRNMRVNSRTPKSLNLLITPPQNNGNIFSYVLRVQGANIVNLTCNNTSHITQTNNSHTINCTNPFTYNITSLHQNTVYDISVQAVNPGGSSEMFTISERTNNMISEPAIDFYVSEEAIPSTPIVACVSKTNSSLEISITSTDNNITEYNVSVQSSQTDWSSPDPSSAIINRTNETVIHYNITGLTAGVKYSITVWSLNEDMHSNTSGAATDRTALNPPQSVTTVSTTTNTINVSWTSPSGYYDGFNVNCTGQNSAITRSYTLDVPATPVSSGTSQPAICTNVTSGAVYNVTVSTFVSDSLSPPATSLASTNAVTVPLPPKNLTARPVSSTSIELSWFYYTPDVSQCTEFRIKENFSSTVHTVQCSNDRLQYQDTLNSLTPDTFYFTWVEAVRNSTTTVQNSSVENTSAWTIPAKVRSMTVNGRTPWSLNLVITPPDNHSNIFEYVVLVVDTSNPQIKHRIALDCGNAHVTPATQCLSGGVGSSISADCGNPPITFNVTDLEPDTVYNISVLAVNPGGCGDVSSIIERTNETYANCSGMQLENHTSGYDWIEISWSEPTDPGGNITRYEVTCMDLISGTNHTNSTTERAIKFQGLHSFTNHSITVIAFTSVGPCPRPPSTVVATAIGPPYSPTILPVEAVDEYTLLVTWYLPSERQTSNVTYYNVTATDDANGTVYVNTSTGTKQLTVTGLHPYWNYRVSVIAFTNNGTFEYVANATNTMMGRTAETTPGPVTNLNVTSLSAQSKCYLAEVTWKEPTSRDQHGIITGYRIDWAKANGESSNSTEVDDPERHQAQVSVDANNQTYKFMVRARTKIGPGVPTNVSLGSTGNCRPEPLANGGDNVFTNTTPSGGEFDDKVSFIVSYDPQVFTSNENGVVLSQGIIVAEENGSLTSYNDSFEYKFDQLKTWSDVKDLNVIVEYRTTPDGWNASNTDGSARRKRREVRASSSQYVVGKDKCSDSKGTYCNGPLHSGRTYRVRAIYCTQSGCYVTKYSSNTFTTKSQESLAWIAGVVIPCILLIVAIVVVVYLWRKNRKLKKYKEASSARSSVGLSNIQHRRSVPIRVSDFAAEVDEKHRNSNLKFAEEYQGIGEISKTELKHPTTFAELPQNRVKNRYSNILAFDHSRVKLYCADPDDPGADYINANYLRDKNRKRDYIATQGPLPGTVDDFWQMIWEQRVRVIVMVTSLVDKSREKCTKYWPDAAETDAVYGNVQSENKRVYGDITVELQSEKSFSNSFYTIRTFQLTNGHKEQRQVKQFYCDKIPDYGIPDDTDAFLDFIRHVRQTAGQELDPPIVVHCSAGVGRTGTFIALERLLRQIRESDTVDIVQLILDMRNDRHFMVQTEVQFICIHDCLKIAIEKQWHRHAPPPVAESSEPESLYANGPFGREVESPYANLGFENLGYQNDNANGVLVNIDGNVNSKGVSRPAKPPVTSKPSNLRNSTISTKGDSNWPNDKEAVPLTTFTGDGKNRPPVNS